MSHYVHHVPGRLRVRSPGLKRNEVQAAWVRSLVHGLDGVARGEVSTVTGSVLISYDPQRTDAGRLLAELGRHGVVPEGVAAESGASPGDYVSRVAQGAGETLGKVVMGMVVEKLVERSAVALVAAVL
jgi:hypothetical protein